MTYPAIMRRVRELSCRYRASAFCMALVGLTVVALNFQAQAKQYVLSPDNTSGLHKVRAGSGEVTMTSNIYTVEVPRGYKAIVHFYSIWEEAVGCHGGGTTCLANGRQKPIRSTGVLTFESTGTITVSATAGSPDGHTEPYFAGTYGTGPVPYYVFVTTYDTAYYYQCSYGIAVEYDPVTPDGPTGFAASQGTYADGVLVSWVGDYAAAYYEVYRSDTTTRPSMPMATVTASPYKDKSAEPGVKYYYWVVAVNSYGSSFSSRTTGYRAVSLELDRSEDAYVTGGGAGSVAVSASAPWNATVVDADWITLGTGSGNSDGILTYTVAANTTGASRTGTIMVTAGSDTTYPERKAISVLQTDFAISDGVLREYTGGGGVVNIPTNVTSIGMGAFKDCRQVTAVMISSGVTSLGRGAFTGCSGLQSVSIPVGVTDIGDFAFCGCAGLSVVVIPPTVNSIGRFAFADCSGLTTVYVSAGDAMRISGLYPFAKSVEFVEMSVPTAVAASDGTDAEKVCVTWLPAKGATSYDLYRSTSASLTGAPIKAGVTSPCDDTTAEPGVKYYYWVAAVSPMGVLLGPCDAGHRAVSLGLGASDVSCPASHYGWFVSVSANTSWNASSDVNWISIAPSTGNGNGTLTYEIAKNGKTHSRKGTITVTAGADSTYPEQRMITVTQDAGDKDEPEFTVSRDDPAGVRLVWDADPKAESYCIDRVSGTNATAAAVNFFLRASERQNGQTNGFYVVTTDCSYLDTTAESGTWYTYYVFANNGSQSYGHQVGWRPPALTSISVEGPPSLIGGTTATYSCLAAYSDGSTSVVKPTWSILGGSDVAAICASGRLTAEKATSTQDVTIRAAFGDKTVEQQVTVCQEVVVDGVLTEYVGTGGAVTVPDAVTSIGANAYAWYGGLATVVIPAGVKSIEAGAFQGSRELTTVIFEGHAPTVGKGAFEKVSDDCTVYVKRGSAGWGTGIPGTWQGLKIQYRPDDASMVLFDANGGAGTMPLGVYEKDRVHALPKCAFKKTGKTFKGWACSNGRRYDDGMLVFDLAQPDETVTMTAIWE